MYELTNLTRNQFLIWTGHQISSHLLIYNEVVTLMIEGPVDRHHFNRAVMAVIERTDSLRTVFKEESGLPRLQVLERMPYELEHVDLSGEHDPQAALDAWITTHRVLPFDLARRCFEIALLKIADNSFVCYLLQHHINTDATSVKLLFCRIADCYARSVAGTLDSVGAYPDFGDYVAFEQQRRATPRYAKSEAYWRRKLAEPSDPVVPMSEPSGEMPSAKAHERIRVELGGDLSDRIRSVAGGDGIRALSEDLSLFSIFAAVLFAYLHRISGSDRIAIGTPWQNRPKRFADTAGLLMEQDPFHATIEPGESFGSLIRKVQAEALEVMRHLPYAAGNPGGSAYTVVLNYLKTSNETFAGIPSRPIWSHSGGGDGSMIVNVQDFEAVTGFTLEFDFDCSAFDPSVRRPTVDHFMNLLMACLEDPTSEIGDAPMLDERERERLTVHWNDTAVAYCEDMCLPQLIEAQVRRSPDATALVHGTREVSYRAMNARANVLARDLRSMGIAVDEVVAVCMPRGLDVPIALLAVMKAGAAYLPLDPDYPPDRLAFMLEDASVGVLLTDSATRQKVFAGDRFTGLRFVCVDEQPSGPPAESLGDAPPIARAHNLAYLIYTSGSTGAPKGVMIEHRGLVNNIAWQIREFGFDPRDRFLQWTTVIFDAAVWELWTPLCVGATQVISDLQDARDPKATLDLIRRESITFAQTVPSFLSAMLNEMATTAEPLPLRLFVVGGEALSDKDARRWAGLCNAELVNMYGPTECSVDACFLRHAGKDPCETISIGRPIANTRIYSLDARMQPVPVGAAGELYIGGHGVARGYLNRPGLTAERFVPDPFTAQPGARLYRTGDRGRFLPDGRIEFLGRTDLQVKVRGYRIELGEIEATLAEHPQVDRCVVVTREDRPGDIRIVAYVVTNAQAPASASLREHLREHLHERLPAHMVPRDIVALDAIPVLPNGKINRNALPAPGDEGDAPAGGSVAPANETESALAAIWQDVLGVRQVGTTDNFFDLGGHSMLAMQVISRLNAAMGVELPLRSLFERPTISGLSAEVQEALLRGGKVIREAIPVTDPAAPAALSFAQEGLWFIDRLRGPSSVYNLAQASRIRGGLSIEALRLALQALVERQGALRTAIEERDGSPVQVVMPVPALPLPVVDVPGATLEAREEALLELLGEGTSRPFQLNEAPLFRARLLRLGEHDHVLQMVMHHIVTDGWSVGVINSDLTSLYEAALNHGPAHVAAVPPIPALPALPVQFRDFATWQRARLQGDRLEQLLGYWRNKLAGVERLVLPADQPRAGELSTRGRMARADIPDGTFERLQTLARSESATVFMVLLAAFKLLMKRYSGQDDVAIGSPVTCRGRDDLDRVVGLFINSVVLRTDLSGDPSFRQLLGRVRQTALDAYAHQELPFETLVADLSPQRTLSGNPLFDVLINHITDDRAQVSFPGCESTDIEPSTAESKFFATLYVVTRERGVTLRLVYRRDLFSEDWGSACLSQFLGLLAQVGEAPDLALAEYALRGGEPRWLLPDPALPMPARAQEPVTRRIMEQAKAAPDASAVTIGDRSWSYAALLGHASTVATILMEDGAKRGDVVAITGPRSPGVVCAMLAVLLAGGVFLTIDERLPAVRKRTMLREARAGVLLHVVEADDSEGLEPGIVRDLDLPHPVRVIRIGAMLDEIPAATTDGAGALLPPIAGEDAAYIFFTSGSTGQPKAVLGCHRGLSQFVEWQRDKFAVGPGDRVSQLIAMSFDPMLRDVFLPLTSGATLCMPTEADLFDVPGWLMRERITVVHTTPSLLQAWLAEVKAPGQLEVLRWLFVSGEPLTDVIVSRWRDRLGSSCRIVNLYGPTETTMARCFHEVADEPQAGVQPIGLPIPDTQVLLLGASGSLCGVNEPGQIAIRTPFRSLGYMNLPEETARRFVQNPFAREPGDLVYLTGDRGRCRPDGLLEFMGRIDDQVKIRGVRVEPAEVAAVLARHPGVRTCAVIAQGTVGGSSELIAYVVKIERHPTEGLQLRAFLKARLPSAIVPASFVFLDAMPLLANGKVDRSALRPPERGARQADYSPPRTPVEGMLLDIWTDLLESPRIGINDDFFDLGGHSLTATRIVSRIRSAFEIDLPLRAIFEAPTIAGLGAVVTGLRRAGSAGGAGGAGGAGSSANVGSSGSVRTRRAAVRCERGAPFPVSFSQRRMWLLQALDPATTAYNMPLTLRLTGRLDRDALFASLRLLAERHESFRTTIVMHGDEPVQIVAASATLEPEVLDLSSWPADSVEERAKQLLDMRAQSPFDLASGPLHRICLVTLGPTDHLLMILMHHAVSDDWSSGILLRELKASYHAARHGVVADLPPVAIQPADHAAWQRKHFGPDEIDEQYVYWRERLRGTSGLALPVDLPVPMIRSWVGARVHSRISPETLRNLFDLSRRQGVTPYMTLLACFQIVLSKYCDQEDIAVGTPIANRTTLESEMLIGTLVNTLVMRACVSPTSSFSAFLGKLVPDVLDSYANQDMPFDYLVERFRNDPELEPLNIRALFNVLNTPWETPQLDGLACELFDVSRGAAQFDLSLSIDLDITCSATLAFTTDIFLPATARRLLDNFMWLVEQVLADPDRCIGDYDIVSAPERSLLDAWNRTEFGYPRQALITDLIEEQVRRRGRATALVSRAGTLSYEELNRRATQLAQVLRARGAGRGQSIGLCIERGAEMVIAQIAVLMSGAAYVPLDPGFPKDRLAYMAADAKLALLVTQSSLAGVVAWPAPQTLMLDLDVLEIARQPVVPLPPDEQSARPEDPAYVIYTSGSTGRPKGVMVPHRAVVNFLATMAREPGLAAGDRLVAVTTLSFDIAVLELLLPLSVGAQVVLAGAEQAADGFALRALLEESAATVMQATPGTWRLLVAAGWRGSRRFKALVGGEPLPLDLAEQLEERTAEVWNMYGPTETTVWSTCWKVENPVAGISIGRPIGNTKVWIRDVRGALCPVGVVGEICISGEGVALGYLDRPELTAGRFVPDDLGGEPGAKLYRTGDRGRWCADGTLEHLGRLDFQVKVRGYRIELGEIEAAMVAHPAVAQCVTTAREDVPGDVRLVAYVVPANGMPSAAAFRDHLGTTLPDYMVPRHFVAIDAVPLLPNGKIDRGSLPAPDYDGPRVDEHHIEPATALEILIADVWRSLLGETRISTTDNFFELGGHSLLAMRAVIAVQERAGIRIEPRRFIFETLGQLAANHDEPPQVATARPPGDDAVKRVVRLLGRLAGAKRKP